MIVIDKMKQKEKRYALINLDSGKFVQRISKNGDIKFCKSVLKAKLFNSCQLVANYWDEKKLSVEEEFEIISVKFKYEIIPAWCDGEYNDIASNFD